VVAVKVAAAGNEAAAHVFIGDVRPRVETALGFRVGGKLVERRVGVGAAVRRGDVLARLDARDQSLQVSGNRSLVEAAQTEYVQQRAEYERFADLHAKNFISQAELDRRRATLDVAKARLAQAKTQWSEGVNQASDTVLRANADGVVTVVAAEVGQVLAPGQPVLHLADLTEKEVLLTVPEHRISEVQRAGQLIVRLWALPGRSFKARVREVSPMADPVTRTYAARVAIADADDAVRLGMSAQVLVPAAAAAGVPVPIGALQRKGAQTAVWVVDEAQGTVSLRPVSVSGIEGEKALVSDGLKPGETVVTAGVQKLHAGQRVRVVAGTQ
jgi:RND family efflux transporter MFP subunit